VTSVQQEGIPPSSGIVTGRDVTTTSGLVTVRRNLTRRNLITSVAMTDYQSDIKKYAYDEAKVENKGIINKFIAYLACRYSK
jgi:hypothetical protein